MDVVDKYLSLLTKLVEEEEVMAAAGRVKEAAILMVDALDSLNLSNASKRKGVLGADVPRELKILLHFFNKDDDKIAYSKELFNNTSPVDPAGKMFLKLVNDMKPETLEYLKENISTDHRYTFEQIETHLKYFYVNYLLCYFLLKNENMSTGINISDADIEIYFATNQTEDPEIQDTVEKVTRFIVGESNEPYVHPKGLSINMERRILEGTMRQVSAIIQQKKQDGVQSIQTKEQIIEAALAETNLAYTELDETRLELAKSASLRDNLEKLIIEQSEIDAVTRQKILDDSDKFTEILRIILNIAKELDNDVDYGEILKRIDEIPIVSDIEDNGDELIQTRNSLLEKQQIQLIMICQHIKEVVVAYSRFQTIIANQVTSNTLLEDENRQITFLIDNLKDDNQQQNIQIVAMQNEIRMLSQTVEEIGQILDAANAQHESSLGIQVEANRELADEYYRIRDREENLKEQIKRLRARVNDLDQSELDQNEEIIQANELIALLEMRIENSKEIISRLEFEAESSNLEKEQAKDKEIQIVRFNYEETIENLTGLLSEKERILAEKQRTIYNLTSSVEEVSAELEQIKIDSREEIDRIVHESLVEIEKINNQLTDEKRVKEEKINEIIAASHVKIEAARVQVKETEEGAESQINELQRKLDNSIREKDELESQFGRTQANTRQELIQQIEEAEAKITDLRVQLEQAKNGAAATLNDLERQIEETTQGAENEKSVMKDKIKRMQFMNLVYLIKLRKLNQIILDNRAKLSFESAKGEEMQLSDEELHELLSEIQNAEDNKTLLLENPFNHIAESIYKKSDIIIQTQGNATHNVNVFIETVEEAKSKITELEGQLVTNNKDLDGVKSAFAKLQKAYEEKNTQLTSIQNELFQSTRDMSVYKNKANSIIRALRNESERKQKEIKDAVHEKISELTADKEKTAQQLSDEKSKSAELEEKIKKLKEKAKKDVAEIKEKYEGQMVLLSEKDTLLRRISQKEENVTRIKKELEKAKSMTATASNKIALQDTIIVELRNEMDALKEKMKSKEQMLSSISELTEQCDALYRKTIANEDQARREVLAIQRVAEGASRIHELTKQLGENNASRISDLENIRIRLKALLDTPNGITRNGINSIFNAL
jgi:hypothetical protein